MRRPGVPFALVSAAVIGAVGAALIVMPAAPPPVDVVDQVGSVPVPDGPAVSAPPFELPQDPPRRERWVAPYRPATLEEGTRIIVPRLRIDLPLELGDIARDVDREATPIGAAFLLPGSAVPGTRGNAYVYAHARTGMFLALWNVRLGDAVEVDTPSGAPLLYVVTEIHPRVDPTDVRYAAGTDDERLTLQTSTGPFSSDPRFVVIARPVR